MKITNQQGYLGVVTVLIVAAVTLTAAVTITLLGVNDLLFSLAVDDSETVLQKVDGCAEEGYYRLKKDPAYTGGTIPYAEGTCTLSISGGGSTRTITATVTVGNYTRAINAAISLESNVGVTAEGIDLTSWDESAL